MSLATTPQLVRLLDRAAPTVLLGMGLMVAAAVALIGA
jgi:hypothetical protein